MEKKKVRRSLADCQQETMALIKFALKKANDSTIPLNVARLCQEFKEETDSSTSALALQVRIGSYRNNIYKLDEFDKNTKIRLMFWLSASVNSEFLEELQKEADVVKLDVKQRIIKYKSKDGSLILEGDHHHSVKIKATAERKRKLETNSLNEMEEEGDQEDGTENPERRKVIRRESTSAQSSSDSRYRRFNRDSIDHDLSLQVDEETEDVAELQNGSVINQNGLPDRRIKTENHAEVHMKTEQQGDQFSVDFTQNLSLSEEGDDSASYQKVLKSLHNMLLILDIESLNVLQEDIKRKMDDAARSKEMISIDMIEWALKSFLHKIQNSAKMDASPDEESTSLKEFLLLLRHTVVCLDLPALDEFQQKMRDLIRSLVIDMVVPVGKIQKALETALAVIDPN